jgi:phosphatidate cytidylyltransferase
MNQHQWSDVPRRLSTIAIGVPILWTLWTQNALRYLFFQITHVLIALEWSHMTAATPSATSRIGSNNRRDGWMLLSHIRFPLLSVLLVNLTNADTFCMALVVATALASLSSSPTESMTTMIVQGVALISIPFRTWIVVASDSTHGFLRTVALLLTVWNCDTGALLVGRVCGGRLNLIPGRLRSQLQRISPKKSVEGLLGGLLLGTVTYVYLPTLFKWLAKFGVSFGHTTPTAVIVLRGESSLRLWPDIGTGLLLSLAAVLGDLWESSLKRHYHVKDTGKLLPGHGGILDRFDSSLIAILVYHVILQHTTAIAASSASRGY